MVLGIVCQRWTLSAPDSENRIILLQILGLNDSARISPTGVGCPSILHPMRGFLKTKGQLPAISVSLTGCAMGTSWKPMLFRCIPVLWRAFRQPASPKPPETLLRHVSLSETLAYHLHSCALMCVRAVFNATCKTLPGPFLNNGLGTVKLKHGESRTNNHKRHREKSRASNHLVKLGLPKA